MDTIKQDIGSKDCLACVAAMATKTSVEEFKSYYIRENLTFNDDITLIRYLEENGYIVGFYVLGDNQFSISQLGCVNLLSVPAYIVVESSHEWVRKQRAWHAVYWDGNKLHDPSSDVQKPKLSEYKVIMCLNIVKDESHPRWQQEAPAALERDNNQ